MDRRLFCQSLALGTAGSALGALPFSAAHAAGGPESGATLSAFNERRSGAPWTLGFEGLQADLAPQPMQLRGKLPKDLRGTLLRNGPAQHSLGDVRYQHWFDGDGMIQQYRFSDQGVRHQARFLRTQKFLAENAAGRRLYHSFGTQVAGGSPMVSADAGNVANTSVVHHAGETLALWEGGSATRFDADTLETGALKTWTPEHAGMPFSAHPKIGADGTLWNFGVSSAHGLLSIYQVSAQGQVRTATLQVPDMAMVHDFAVTEQHLVFLLPPLVFDLDRAHAGSTFLDSHVWKPQLGMRALVLHKDRLDQPQWMELPTGFLFHTGNAWEDGKGVIHLDYIRSDDDSAINRGFRGLMRGDFQGEPSLAVALVELDTRTGRARQTLQAHHAEFPRIDPRFVGRRHRELFMAERVAVSNRPGFDCVARLNVDTGKVDRYRYGTDVMVEEHVFIPASTAGAREGDGWLVGTALDLLRRRTLLSVFDARRLAQGPLAQGSMDRAVPLGFHGTFIPA
ncbi:carotenoid oxygenase family protein [Acidovorax sp. LjRoot118]|uniref:carotenoid oxygenase family protein n=1 Tax=unclassified Acidovorax TaxID=2684926 RepID=UPI003ECE0422